MACRNPKAIGGIRRVRRRRWARGVLASPDDAAPRLRRKNGLAGRNISLLAKVAPTGQKKLDTKKRQRRTI